MSNSETNVFFIARRIRQAKASVEMRAKRATESVGLRMGIEFLTEGTMYVERADGTELLEIKRGAWPLEKVKAEAERLFQTGARGLRPFDTSTRTGSKSLREVMRKDDC
jgi:hypothetical protein